MKKLILALVAVVALGACSGGEREYLSWRGLSMALSYKAFYDSLMARGYEVDTAHSGDNVIKFTHPNETYVLTVGQLNDTIQAIEEFYTASYNDSTRHLWQEMRDLYAKELDCMPGCPYLLDDHKEALFDTEKGRVNIVLQNRSIPTLTVHLDRKMRGEE